MRKNYINVSSLFTNITITAMKKENMKSVYVEPQTLVNLVELEGFICHSVLTLYKTMEVDEYVNKGELNLDFDQ